MTRRLVGTFIGSAFPPGFLSQNGLHQPAGSQDVVR